MTTFSSIGFSQGTLNESYKMVSLDGMTDIRQTLSGHPTETNYTINLSCTDSKNKTQKIAIVFSEKEEKDIVQTKSYSPAIFIYLPLNEYESFYHMVEQIFIKKELRGALNVNVIPGTNMATFYYYPTNN